MNIRDRKGLILQAQTQLHAAAYDPKKLSLIHSAVGVGLTLVLSLLSLYLSQGIDQTGGLSGIGTRNLLETIQSLLNLAHLFLMPFWQISIVFSFLCVVRSKPAEPSSLLQGFRRFGPVLRLNLIEMLVLFLVAMLCAYTASFFGILCSPRLYALLEPIAMEMAQNPYADMQAMVNALDPDLLMQAMIPMLIIFVVLYLGAAWLLSYPLRFTRYLIQDDPRMGAFAAIVASLRLTWGHYWDLMKLDFGFWLYYLLQVLVMAVCYGDMLLELLGITLPMDGQWVTFLCSCIYSVLLLALHTFLRPKVEATYALAYDTLRNPPLCMPTQSPYL